MLVVLYIVLNPYRNKGGREEGRRGREERRGGWKDGRKGGGEEGRRGGRVC